MNTLIYNELEPERIPHFDKILRFLQQDDSRDAVIDEDRIPYVPDPDQVELRPLAYANPAHQPLPKSPSFHKSRGTGPACA